jgi:exodeoxyribonuclease VII small subunit
MAKEEIKYNQAIEELNRILERIQTEKVDVDDLSKEVKRAVQLIKLCKDKIEKTEMEVKKITKEFE